MARTDSDSLVINLITPPAREGERKRMIYIDGKPTKKPCFGDVDIFKDKDGNILEVIFHF